jgi:hypothetical protein
MNIQERLSQIEQAHAQHVQLMQQTQANIIRLEGAAEILREQLADEQQQQAPAPNRKARRAASKLREVPPPAPPTEPVEPPQPA